MKITGIDIQNMVAHWLQTPVNGYLGSDYGQEIKSLLQLPQGDTAAADAQLGKLRHDVPALQIYNPRDVAIYGYDNPSRPDRRGILIAVAGKGIEVDLGG